MKNKEWFLVNCLHLAATPWDVLSSLINNLFRILLWVKWILCQKLSYIRERNSFPHYHPLFCVEQGLWQYWFMEVLMDLENIKRMSFLIVFLFLKMNLLKYDLSPCSLSERRDKTCINKFPSMLKARGARVQNSLRKGLFSVNWLSQTVISQQQNHNFKWVEERWIVEIVTSVLLFFLNFIFRNSNSWRWQSLPFVQSKNQWFL